MLKIIHTKSDCYKANRKIKPKGIMVHSTGANNPYLRRYVGTHPELGTNQYNNDWNRGGLNVAVHAFIGFDKDKNVRIAQVLPWDIRGWHSGRSANDTHISFEICESNLNDKEYFDKAYQKAIELCVLLCKEFNLTEKDIIDHAEGYKKGIASNHGDVGHWFPKHGKSMNTLRADVKKILTGNKAVNTVDINKLAREVIAGKHGNGDARKKALGTNYSAVQKRVNEILKRNVVVKFNLTRLLKNGSRGNDVKELQKALGGLSVDGIFGAKTLSKVKAYQKSKKLYQDGIVGKNTAHQLGWLYLNK